MSKKKRWSDMASCSSALEVRLAVNRQLGTRDFDSWVLAQLQPKPGEHILDVGCGTGKFTIPSAQAVGTEGHVTGLDTSEESLGKLKAHAEELGLRVATVCARMEAIVHHLPADFFDAALSSYALYYSSSPKQTIRDIRRCLKHGGRLLVVGPDRRNNKELIDLLLQVTRIPETYEYTQNFNYEIVIPTCKQLFAGVSIGRFENPVIFSDANTLFQYWKSGGYYRAEAEDAVEQSMKVYFLQHSELVVRKRVMSVLALGAKA